MAQGRARMAHELGVRLKGYGRAQTGLAFVEFVTIFLLIPFGEQIAGRHIDFNDASQIDEILQGDLLAQGIVLLILLLAFGIGIFVVLIYRIIFMVQLARVMRETVSLYLRNLLILEIVDIVFWGTLVIVGAARMEAALLIYESISAGLMGGALWFLKKWVEDILGPAVTRSSGLRARAYIQIRLACLAAAALVCLVRLSFPLMGQVGLVLVFGLLSVAGAMLWLLGRQLEVWYH